MFDVVIGKERRLRPIRAGALEATLVTATVDYMIRIPGLRVEDWSRD